MSTKPQRKHPAEITNFPAAGSSNDLFPEPGATQEWIALLTHVYMEAGLTVPRAFESAKADVICGFPPFTREAA